jgi:hypothetical protein
MALSVSREGFAADHSKRPVGGPLSGVPASLRKQLVSALLLAGSLVAMAVPIVSSPVRLLLNLLPYALVFGAVWWTLARSVTPFLRNLLLATLALLCVAPAYRDDAVTRAAASSQLNSPVIWSSTLQHPAQAILVQLDQPAAPEGRHRLTVWLAAEYRGTAKLTAEIGGAAIGTLRPRPADAEHDEDFTKLTADVPPGLLTARPTVDVVLRQDRPDASLRVITFRRPASRTLPERPSWFFDGERWHEGVVRPSDGIVVPGMPAVLLEPIP